MGAKDLQDYALNLAALAETKQSEKPKPKPLSRTGAEGDLHVLRLHLGR